MYMYIFSRFSFLKSLRRFPFLSLGSLISHQTSQLAVFLFYRDMLVMSAGCIILSLKTRLYSFSPGFRRVCKIAERDY